VGGDEPSLSGSDTFSSEGSSFFDRNSQFEARRDEMDDNLSSDSSFRPQNANDITRAQKVVSTISAFRNVLSKIIQTTPNLNTLVKQITPLFGYLNQTQVDTLKQLTLSCINMFNEIARAVNQDLGETNRERTALFKSLELINDGIIQKNLTMIGRLVQSYNPIIVPFNAGSINDAGSGYTLATGVDDGAYV
jgi:hypothetical protein